ncbi:MAG: tRNA (cytidine(34)-2'-O)-methyltransferase [Deltaproteobacteria bacterium]|nr:tRNA (cytidine(34)-2'-O)-methyltransferase [Deltaproteobacteria bacterium]
MVCANLHIVLYQPVIPQNTGSIARLCACTGATLHLIHPLGFKTDEASVKRAGLDYWPYVGVREHENWDAFLQNEQPTDLRFFSKFSNQDYSKADFPLPCYLVFGNETKGLPALMREKYASQLFKIPMRTHLVRSLNLAQCTAIALYEALRQNNFRELDSPQKKLDSCTPVT